MSEVRCQVSEVGGRRSEVGSRVEISLADLWFAVRQDGQDFFAIGTGYREVVGDNRFGAYNWFGVSTFSVRSARAYPLGNDGIDRSDSYPKEANS